MHEARAYTVREAASLLGYSRQQANSYVKRGLLESFPDPETGHARVTRAAIQAFLAEPPSRARPGRRTYTTASFDLPALAARLDILEDTDRNLDTLADRISRLEAAPSPPLDDSVCSAETADSSDSEMWRRRANSARDAAAAIAAVGGLYESAIDLLREARRLERQADDQRAQADTALDGARKAWQAAVTAFTTPDDPGEFGRPSASNESN